MARKASHMGVADNPTTSSGHYLMEVTSGPTVMNSPLDDATLVSAARAGSKAAFSTLLERHRSTLAGVCRKVLADADLAEDAAQEASLQALLGIETLRSPERFGSWLVGIGLNVCRHWLRQRAREWSSEALSGGWLEPERDSVELEPGPEELAEAAEVASRVRKAIAELPSGQRAAVVGFYLSGLSYRETATVLGIGIPAAKARLHKGRASLRKRLRSLREEQVMAASDVVEMRVADVRRGVREDDKPRAFLIVLDEVDGDRRLSIWTGEETGMPLVFSLEKVELFRPLTHHFLFKSLDAVGARVAEVRIDQLAERTFYATAVLEGGAGPVEVDARPSDALHLAVLTGAPIRVKAEVVDAARETTEEVLGTLDEKFPEGSVAILEAMRAAGSPPASPADPT